MNCNEARQHWNLYHDSEGDVELHFRIEEHLANCPGCVEWFHKQSRLEDLLVQKLAAHTPEPELWNRVLVASGLVKPASTRRWILFSGMAACAAAVVLLLLWNGRPSSAVTANDIVELTSNWHERLATGKEPLQFRSQSDLEVEDYLRHQVSFPVRCPPRKDAGFAVQGAGVCRLADQPAAYLAGHVDMTPVSIFVMRRESLAAFPHQRAAMHGKIQRSRAGSLESVLGVIDRNAVLVVGRTDPDKLDRVLRAYGTYPHHL
ncbi:MAG: zf-HC2 domain-containing protein [Planctomycetia bacterium]|nr:zf-HC2 domain-containing protein [Planctomycetia bacterium]